MTKTQNKHNIIADRYADALTEIVKSGKLTYERVTQDLNTIESTLNQSVDLDGFLTNPLISVEDKIAVIDQVFASELDVLVVNFLKILVEKDRFSIFRNIVASYNEALDAFNNVSRIEVTSAVHLSDEAKNRLQEKLENKLQKSVVLNWEINPDIIAGLIIKMGDNVIDSSLKNKLEELSKNIVK